MPRFCLVQDCNRIAPYVDYCRRHKEQIYRHGYILPEPEPDRRLGSYIYNGVGYIPATKQQIIKCDAADFAFLNSHRWVADIRPTKIYAFCTKEHTKKYLHRLLLNVTDPNLTVDHINRDTLDNRRSNLRVVSYSSNGQNRPKLSGTTSQYIGVCFYKNRWRSRIRFNCKEQNLGLFLNEEDAAIYYDIAAQLFYGHGAMLNNI